jgi:hypothetical protein
MDIKPERITSGPLLAVLAAFTGLGAVIAVAGLIAAGPDDDSAMRAYVVGLVVAVAVGLLLVTLFEARRRALSRARVRAGELARRLERIHQGGADVDEAGVRESAHALVDVFTHAGAHADAQRLAALARDSEAEPPAPIRLGAAATS